MNTSQACVLVTRPRSESLQIQKYLQKKGHRALQAPLLTIKPLLQKPLEAPLPPTIQGWIFSSSNGVFHTMRAFSHHPLFLSVWRHQTAIAVGPVTSEALEKAGFSNIIVAEPHNSDGLFSYALSRFDPDRGTIFHPGNLLATGRIVERLQEQSLDARSLALYHTQPLETLPPHVIHAFQNHALSHVFLFSVATAETFLHLVQKHNLASTLSLCTALCLSQTIFDVVKDLPWKDHALSHAPHYQALCDLIPPSVP